MTTEHTSIITSSVIILPSKSVVQGIRLDIFEHTVKKTVQPSGDLRAAFLSLRSPANDACSETGGDESYYVSGNTGVRVEKGDNYRGSTQRLGY